MAAGAGGRDRLRASRADREQAIEVLKAAFVDERLDRDELDLRVGRALASRTWADLAALTADIPAPLTRTQPAGAGLAGARLPEPAREAVSRRAVAAMAGVTAAFIGTWPVMLVTPDGAPFAVPVVAIFFALAMATSTGWLVLLHDWLDKRAARPRPAAQPRALAGIDP